MPNGSSNFDPNGLPLFPKLILIWLLLHEHHNIFNSAVPCPFPQTTQLLPNFLSWKNHPVPAIHHKWTKAICRHFIWVLAPFSQLQRSQEASRMVLFSAALPGLFQRPCIHIYASHFLSTLTFASTLMTILAFVI